MIHCKHLWICAWITACIEIALFSSAKNLLIPLSALLLINHEIHYCTWPHDVVSLHERHVELGITSYDLDCYTLRHTIGHMLFVWVYSSCLTHQPNLVIGMTLYFETLPSFCNRCQCHLFWWTIFSCVWSTYYITEVDLTLGWYHHADAIILFYSSKYGVLRLYNVCTQ